LLPGESMDEIEQAWPSYDASMRGLVNALHPFPQAAPAAPTPKITDEALKSHQLVGPPGESKRSTLGRLKDRFMAFWNSQPRDNEKRAKAADAAQDYLELGETLVESIPGHEMVVEFVSLIRQLIKVRAKRGF